MSNTTGQWCDGNSVELLINEMKLLRRLARV